MTKRKVSLITFILSLAIYFYIYISLELVRFKLDSNEMTDLIIRIDDIDLRALIIFVSSLNAIIFSLLYFQDEKRNDILDH